ncbi:MAG TPA: UDP-N-acetyl-D-mannosamine dehydrogenase [Anaerolineaceae bacterium]|nr:UDP-N-acetyl-D-mannosamine dehydrogenase [Anaerolineaceae bacterium]
MVKDFDNLPKPVILWHNHFIFLNKGKSVQINSICVIGLGYIGLPTASTFATHGVQVTGVDNNLEVVKSLQSGKVHIFEPGLNEVVQEAIQSGNFHVSQKTVAADAFIIAVPTPFFDGKKADMRFVEAAAESIVPVLHKGNLVVLESTSPPLTTRDRVLPILEKSGLKAGQDFLLAYSPERVLPGKIMDELIHNARVIGGIDQASAEAGRDLYRTFVEGEIYTTDSTTSEMVKLMENTYRDINIAIANEFSRLADRFGVDVWEAISIANKHPRVKILNPGPGVGGHCISVDPWFFVETAPDITPLINTARNVNDQQPDFVISMVKRALGDLKTKKIAVLGLAFKPDVDDLRESPAVEVAEKLHKAGAEVLACEPYKPDFKLEGITVSASMEEVVKSADAVMFLVGHSQFKSLNPSELQKITSSRLILDCVDALDWEKTENRQPWLDAGFTVYRLGDRKNQ